MSEKKSFVLYHSYAQAFEMLSMEERGQLISAVFEHETGIELCTEELSAAVRMAFAFIGDTLTRDAEAYEEKCRINAENGKKGGRPRGVFKKKNTPAHEQKEQEICGDRAEQDAPSAPSAPSEPNIDEKAREELMEKGVPTAYFCERAARACAYARAHARSVVDVLTDWWNKDKKSNTASTALTNFSHSDDYFEDWFLRRCERAFV